MKKFMHSKTPPNQQKQKNPDRKWMRVVAFGTDGAVYENRGAPPGFSQVQQSPLVTTGLACAEPCTSRAEGA